MLSIFAAMGCKNIAARRCWRRGWVGTLLGFVFATILQAQQPGGLSFPKLLCMHEQVLGIPQTYHPEVRAYRFLAAGHWYGAHENFRALAPASSLLSAIPEIREKQADWIFALGDVVRDADDTRQGLLYDNALMAMGQSAIIVPGNHDLNADGKVNFGLGTIFDCFNSFGDLFILLETEKLIHGGGRAMLAQLRSLPSRCTNGRNVFVFSHRLLWALTEPGFAEMDDYANEPFAPLVRADTLNMVYNAVLKLAADRPMYWFSGDIGASWSLNVFEGHSQDGKRHFYAAGLGDCEEDAFWEVNVDSLGNVQTNIFQLNPRLGKDSLQCDIDHWRKTMTMRRNSQKPSYLAQLKANWRTLLLGIVLGMALLASFNWWRKRRKKSA